LFHLCCQINYGCLDIMLEFIMLGKKKLDFCSRLYVYVSIVSLSMSPSLVSHKSMCLHCVNFVIFSSLYRHRLWFLLLRVTSTCHSLYLSTISNLSWKLNSAFVLWICSRCSSATYTISICHKILWTPWTSLFLFFPQNILHKYWECIDSIII